MEFTPKWNVLREDHYLCVFIAVESESRMLLLNYNNNKIGVLVKLGTDIFLPDSSKKPSSNIGG